MKWITVIVVMLLSAASANAQDSTLVREFCDTFRVNSDTVDDASQVIRSFEALTRYFDRHPFTGDGQEQEALRIQYRLALELRNSCPAYPFERLRLGPNNVIDLENDLNAPQIDSLDVMLSEVNVDKKVFLYIVTIGQFAPDSTIVEFSNRYRDAWAPWAIPRRGVVLVAVSTTHRAIRISTGNTSTAYLTDLECDEVIKIMIPYFKSGKYFAGLVKGVAEIRKRL
jgi:hypothetical protein